jgi:hypothetical protein
LEPPAATLFVWVGFLREGAVMTKPRNSGQHSDISGVHQDERPNVETSVEAGQDTADLERARKLAKGRPDTGGDQSEKGAGKTQRGSG